MAALGLSWGHPIGPRVRTPSPRVRTPSRLLSEDTLSTPGWGHSLLGFWVRTPTRLLGEDNQLAPFPVPDQLICGLCMKLSHDSSWMPNALCSRNWHALGTRLKAQTFRPICKIQQLTGWTTTLAWGLEHARIVSGCVRTPCLGEVT